MSGETPGQAAYPYAVGDQVTVSGTVMAVNSRSDWVTVQAGDSMFCVDDATRNARLAARQPQPAPDARRALLGILDAVGHLDEPGPEADHIRLLALHGLGEGPHPGGGIVIDVAPPPGVTVNGIPLDDLGAPAPQPAPGDPSAAVDREVKAWLDRRTATALATAPGIDDREQGKRQGIEQLRYTHLDDYWYVLTPAILAALGGEPQPAPDTPGSVARPGDSAAGQGDTGNGQNGQQPAPELAADIRQLANDLEAEGREEISIAKGRRQGVSHQVGMNRGRVFELCAGRIRRTLDGHQ